MLFTEFYIANYIAPVTEPIDLTSPKSIILATPVPKRRKKKLTAKAAQAAAEAAAEAIDVVKEAALKAEDEAA